MTVSTPARLLIIGAWTECDDQGVFEWKPVTLKVRIFPADNVDVAALLEELRSVDFVRQFQEDGKSYGAVRNFQKWQRPKAPRASFPLPENLTEYVGASEAPEDSEQALRRRKHAEAGGKCTYCRTAITYYAKRHETLEIDHVIPKCVGGTDDDANLVAACRSCNRSKGKMTGDEFRAWLRKRLDGPTFAASNANTPNAGANGEIAPQMEDGGWNRKEDRNLSVPCPEADKPLRTRAAYSEEFEAWWKVYPTDPLMSKKDAYTQWKRLPLPDREMAVKSLTAFKAYCASKPDYRPVHANRYLSQRRFDGFGQFVEQSTGKVWVKIGTSQFDAWNTWYQDTQGKSAPRSSKGGWYFPSEYPPTAQRAFIPSEFPTQARA